MKSARILKLVNLLMPYFKNLCPNLPKGNEKCVLLVGGEVYPGYTHTLDHSGTTMRQGARDTLMPCVLTDEEHELYSDLAKKLHEEGCNYAGIDLAFPNIIEVNVLNPDGLRRMHMLTGNDRSAEIVEQAVQATLETHEEKERPTSIASLLKRGDRSGGWGQHIGR